MPSFFAAKPFSGGGVVSPSLVFPRGFTPNFFTAPVATPLLGSLLTNPFNGPGEMPDVSFDFMFDGAGLIVTLELPTPPADDLNDKSFSLLAIPFNGSRKDPFSLDSRGSNPIDLSDLTILLSSTSSADASVPDLLEPNSCIRFFRLSSTIKFCSFIHLSCSSRALLSLTKSIGLSYLTVSLTMADAVSPRSEAKNGERDCVNFIGCSLFDLTLIGCSVAEIDF